MTLPLPPGPFGTVVADPAWRFDRRTIRGAAEKHYKTMTVEQIARLPVEEIVAENAQLFLWAPDAFIVDGSASLVARMWGFKPKQLVCWRKVKVTSDEIGAAIDAALSMLTKHTFAQQKDKFIALDGELENVLQALADVRKALNPQMGQGYYLRHCFELALLCVRGKATAPEGAKNILAMFDAERTDEHSEKPDEIFRIAARLSPGGARLEMFARAAREGWTVWGDQAPSAAGSPEQITERLNERVRKIMEDGEQQIAQLFEGHDKPNLLAMPPLAALASPVVGVGHVVGCYVNGMAEDGVTETWMCVDECPIRHTERDSALRPPPDGYISRRSKVLNETAAYAERATREIVGIIRDVRLRYDPIMLAFVTSSDNTMISPEFGNMYRLPDGRVGEYVGGASNFHVKSGPNGDGSIWKVLGEVSVTDLAAAVWCQTCGWLIAAEAAENAEACPYCARSAGENESRP